MKSNEAKKRTRRNFRIKKKSSQAYNYGIINKWDQETPKRKNFLNKIGLNKDEDAKRIKTEKKIMREVYQNEGLKGILENCQPKKRNCQMIENYGAPYLFEIDSYVTAKLELLIQKTFDEMDPFLNGLISTKENLCVEVEDEKMSSFIVAMSESGVWECLKQNKMIGSGCSQREVKAYKWRTNDITSLSSFLKSFTRVSQNDLIERHFIHQSDCLDVSKSKQISSFFVENMRSIGYSTVAQFYKIPGNKHSISSCKMVIGIMNQLSSNAKNKQQGYFTIEYVKGKYENLKMGTLSFSFRYKNYLDGRINGYKN